MSLLQSRSAILKRKKSIKRRGHPPKVKSLKETNKEKAPSCHKLY